MVVLKNCGWVSAVLPPKNWITAFRNFGWQVMTDPDAPSPSEPSMREWVHW